jgi:ATP-dependent RNA helicase DDX5/DBP2
MSNLGGGLRTIDWATTKIEHFEKNFYIEDKKVKERSDKEIEEFKREKEIKVNEDPLPCPRL